MADPHQEWTDWNREIGAWVAACPGLPEAVPVVGDELAAASIAVAIVILKRKCGLLFTALHFVVPDQDRQVELILEVEDALYPGRCADQD